MIAQIERLGRFWFTFEERVDRGTYFRHGLGLMVVKYALDATLIGLVLGVVWTPWDYATNGVALPLSKLKYAPPWLLLSLSLWTLPFLWIGLTLTLRRALDAGRSAWLALLFFVPIVNYVFMLDMSVRPSAPPRLPATAPREYESKLPSALLSIAAGMGVGLGMMGVSVFGMSSYGLPLFVGSPFVAGAITAFVFNKRYAATHGETNEVVLLTVAAIGGAALALAMEGAVCLLMALPLGLVFSLMGAALGRAIALRDPLASPYAIIAVLLLPGAAPLVDARTPIGIYEVRSTIDIDASPDAVWKRVIAFPPLAPPRDLIFRAGIAYPERAHIVGTGVGATRFCVFSTGVFVEPIRVWDPGKRLSFDITAQPPPMREMTPYANVSAPHLDGFVVARRGDFRLVSLGPNRTRLIGSTWYEMRIHPVAYWSLYADLFVSRIHRRVLEHIKAVAEADASVGNGS